MLEAERVLCLCVFSFHVKYIIIKITWQIVIIKVRVHKDCYKVRIQLKNIKNIST